MEAKAFPMLTPREIKLITALIVDGDLNIKPDWEKVSKSAGLKNKKAASDSWYLLKKKLNKVNTGAGAEEGDDSSKKRKATDDDADEADAEPVGKTTVKRTRKPTKKAAQASSDIKEEAIEEGV